MHMLSVAPTLTAMAETDEDIRVAARNWITQTIERGYPHATALSDAAGVAQSSLSRFLKSPDYMLSSSTLSRIARVSEVAIPNQLKKLLDRSPANRQEQSVNHFSGVIKNGIPVWGCHPIARDGEFRLNPIALQVLGRPNGMSASHKVIAFYAPDETMAPRWTAGEIVLVDLARPGTTGDVVLVTLLASPEQPNETETAMLRRLDGRNSGHLRLSSFERDSEAVSIPIQRVAEVRHALSWNDILR